MKAANMFHEKLGKRMVIYNMVCWNSFCTFDDHP